MAVDVGFSGLHSEMEAIVWIEPDVDPRGCLEGLRLHDSLPSVLPVW
jgi:hypothetical protein